MMQESNWINAEKYAKRALKKLKKLQNNSKEEIVKHGRIVQKISFPSENSSTLLSRFNYVKKIFSSQKSFGELLELANQSFESAQGFDNLFYSFIFVSFSINTYKTILKNETYKQEALYSLESIKKTLLNMSNIVTTEASHASISSYILTIDKIINKNQINTTTGDIYLNT